MKRVVLLLWILMPATHAVAGTVGFRPAFADVFAGHGSVMVDVILRSDELDDWDAAAILFGSDLVDLISFEWDQVMEDLAAFAPFAVADDSVYAGGILAGIFLTTPVNDIKIGTLEIGAPDYEHAFSEVVVDSLADDALSSLTLGLETEGLFGTLPVALNIPEPATLAMLSIGLLALRRRQTADHNEGKQPQTWARLAAGEPFVAPSLRRFVASSLRRFPSPRSGRLNQLAEGERKLRSTGRKPGE